MSQPTSSKRFFRIFFYEWLNYLLHEAVTGLKYSPRCKDITQGRTLYWIVLAIFVTKLFTLSSRGCTWRCTCKLKFPVIYFYNQVFYFAFIVDKCAKCDSHARCDNGNCVCMEGWVGDGQTCSPKEGGGRK